MSWEEMTLAANEARVRLDGRPYVLREASAATTIRFQQRQAAGLKYGEDGKVVGWQGDGMHEPEAVAACLCLADDAGNPIPNGDGFKTVPLKELLSWPGRVQERLFERLKEISPELAPVETAESLRRQIARLQARLDRLEGPAKNPTTP